MISLSTGSQIWITEAGEGPTVLQIHGSGFGHKNFAKLTPVLSRSLHVIDFDLPGFGASDPPNHDGSIHKLADDVADLIRALGYPSVHVHGTSMGGVIAISLASRHPEVVDRLILSCCMGRYDNAARAMRATWKTAAKYGGMQALVDLTAVAGFSRSFFDSDEAAPLLHWMRAVMKQTRPEVFATVTESLEQLNLEPLAGQIQAPTLLLAGAQDMMTPVEAAPSGIGLKALNRLIPNSQLVVFPNQSHYMVFEQPGMVSDAIASFTTGGPLSQKLLADYNDLQRAV